MSFSAIQSAGDAIDVTREYLFGRSIRGGALLAFMVLFLGPTGVSGPPGPIELDDEAFQTENEVPTLDEVFEFVSLEWLTVVAVIVIALAIGYALLSAFMEFSFIHSLVTDTVSISKAARSHWREALGLFIFRVVLWGFVAGLVALLTLTTVDLVELPVDVEFAFLLPLAIAGGVMLYLLNRFTTDFVAPIMYHEHRGVLGGWWRLLAVMRREWRQFAVYVPVRIILEIALGIAFGIVLALGLFLIALVIGIPIGIILVLVLDPLIGFVITVAILGLIAIAVIAGAMVPFHTYLRYYTLLVLGDTAETLDLISEKRHIVREGA